MVTFEWKYTEKEQYPPEPGETKNGWQETHPGWIEYPHMICDWWSRVFEMYACRLRGDFSPVPVNLYYIGDNEWMDECGHVYAEGHVIAWDSYTQEGETG